MEGERMTYKTCAACDCRLEGAAIKVTVGGKIVDVCCDDCAKALNEAYAPAPSVAPTGG
jgi:ribosome-binding protein aMBF1 (putative translation factor)